MMNDITVKLYGIAPDGAELISGADAQAIISALSGEIKELTAERDAFAAHNRELVSACELAIDMFVASNCNVPNAIEALQDAIDENPQQRLREIRAEAGRSGFVEGAKSMKLAFQYGGTYNTEDKANQYAAKVRQGGA